VKLSVCIPVYNVAPYIEQCARSLFEQTYREIEYLFVDDCSPDDSIDVVRRVLKGYPDRADQVKFLRHGRNRGLIAARKTALRAATGALVTHCDSDDWVDVDLYEKMIDRMSAKGADAVICSTVCHYPDRTIVGRCRDDLSLSGVEAMRQMDLIPGLNAMYTKIWRRELVDLDRIEWPDEISIAEDYCHTMQVLPMCRLLVGLSSPCYHYRVNANSMTRSGNVRRLVEHHMRVYEILTRQVPDEAGVARRNLIRSILFWGTVCGLLPTEDFNRWREIYTTLDGSWDWSDKSLWGQRMMKLADKSVGLSRLVSPFVKGHVHDYL